MLEVHPKQSPSTPAICILALLLLAPGAGICAPSLHFERYFPYSWTYADPQIIVQANDKTYREVLAQDVNPHSLTSTGKDGSDRAYFLSSIGQFRDVAGVYVDFIDATSTTSVARISLRYELTGDLSHQCYSPVNGGPLVLAAPQSAETEMANVVQPVSNCYTDAASFGSNMEVNVVRSAPRRLRTGDGTELDVVDVKLSRDNAPWRSWQFAWNLGLVGISSDNAAAPLEIRPVSVPLPPVEGVIVEFRNSADFPDSPGGHFFYTGDPSEQAAIDSGAAGKWTRTGRSFKTGGYIPVCRFYGSLSPGPNSHFFTANDSECKSLESLQVTPAPDYPQWNSEGRGFSVMMPVATGSGDLVCQSGMIAVRRAYNSAYTDAGRRNPWDSNHRYAVAQGDIAAMVRQGWKDEGVVFCVPQ